MEIVGFAKARASFALAENFGKVARRLAWRVDLQSRGDFFAVSFLRSGYYGEVCAAVVRRSFGDLLVVFFARLLRAIRLVFAWDFMRFARRFLPRLCAAIMRSILAR